MFPYVKTDNYVASAPASVTQLCYTAITQHQVNPFQGQGVYEVLPMTYQIE